MSRRRGEFEHRTSIFEGAFRAWSHLGGLDPEDLESIPSADLDPLTYHIRNDTRIKGGGAKPETIDGRRDFPYEPLPRSGLAHPYVQAILSPWLGPDADNEAIQLGLTTLRTWWQHRRKGESGSAVAALGTEKMKGVVEGYTRHFFTLAHCLVVNDKEQPPRTLHGKMKALEKSRGKLKKKAGAGVSDSITSSRSNMSQSATSTVTSSASSANNEDDGLSPLERLHMAQRRQLAEGHGVLNAGSGGMMSNDITSTPVINLKGKCIPGKVDLPQVLEQVNHHATQLAHAGRSNMMSGGMVPTTVKSGNMGVPAMDPSAYGDPNTTPVVFVSANGDIQISMKVDGITCAHCVKIVETVLRGCNGNKSPIAGLLDAAADRVLNSVLIKIDRASDAKRIAFEAARNLSMVGYTAKVKEMSIVGKGGDGKSTMDLGALATAWEVVASTSTQDSFNWTIPCSCPDNGVLREDCGRHSQMGNRIFDAFDARERDVTEYMAGHAMKKNGVAPPHQPSSNGGGIVLGVDTAIIENQIAEMSNMDEPIHVDQPLDFSFGMAPPAPVPSVPVQGSMPTNTGSNPRAPQQQYNGTSGSNEQQQEGGLRRRSERNPSILSFGNGPRGMSLTSETTFGRAMSGLSALSIDWENLDDFDLDVDHSAHINANNARGGPNPKRSSLRRSYMATENTDGAGPASHVSFQI